MTSHWRGRDLAWGQSVSIVVTHKKIYIQELGDNRGQGNLDEDDIYIRTQCPEHCRFPNDMAASDDPLPSDTAGLALWNQILLGISNIALKGQLTVMEAQSMRRTMLWVILTAVSRILSLALLFGGGKCYGFNEGTTWQQEATVMGEVSRETAWEAVSTMVQGSGEGKAMVAREQGRGREKNI